MCIPISLLPRPLYRISFTCTPNMPVVKPNWGPIPTRDISIKCSQMSDEGLCSGASQMTASESGYCMLKRSIAARQ
ncbi:unnamed protein product [Protopolystoma xenopodis]|uniref:Uncharacterized protein n=1 Tax=Protopolystoma xenopodis TaxID=117903 RepID=A0A448X6A8_9PLAT|nr:unnamed protein product [Protopolystoma xenopodis]